MITRKKLINYLTEKGLYEEPFGLIVDKLYETDELLKVAKKSIKTEGINIFSERGSRKNPAVDMVGPLLREYRNLCAELKITPKSAGLQPAEEDDGFDDI